MKKNRLLAVFVVVAIFSIASTSCYSKSVTEYTQKSNQELARLATLVKDFKIIKLPKGSGNIKINPNDALTIDKLRGIKIDNSPPKFSGKTPKYKKHMIDGLPAGQAPYVAKKIAPFRFKYFNCEFSYGGWHNFNMVDYASLHGFNIIYPYVMTGKEIAHFPKGTKILKWGNVKWHQWFNKNHPGVPGGAYRFDLVNNAGMTKMAQASELLDEKKLGPIYKAHDIIMLDMEHPVSSEANLLLQSWYPKSKSARKAFRKRYYAGYAQSFIAPAKLAKKNGWKEVGIYGWQPFGRTWGGLENPKYAEGHGAAWGLFGKAIYQNVDVIYNSVYSFYWSPQNTAYTLANIDINMDIINAQPKRKPLRPYYWPLLHGGGAGDRWWRYQPIALDEMRAMIAMAFFSGVDGIVCWGWGGTGNGHVAGIGSKRYFKSSDMMLNGPMTAKGTNGKEIKFQAGEVIRLVGQDKEAGTALFKKLMAKSDNKTGLMRKKNSIICNMKVSELEKYTRIRTETISAMVEGMALIKPLEYTLRHGTVKIDVPAKLQFKKTLPIVRRVKLGKTNIIITYDPAIAYGGSPRTIILKDFDGVKGRTLTLPADQQTRIFVLKDGEK